MEGMDLFNMFSTDFVEGDTNITDNFNQIADNDFQQQFDENGKIKQEILESDNEQDDEINETQSNRNQNSNAVGVDADDDDAVFDFALEPIVKMNVTPQTPNNRTMNNSYTPGQRPTPSQINATDENGMPINYELGVTYICPACSEEFVAQDKWKAHMNQLHDYNTARGLNFVRVDKLYHQCLECEKHIAMHSMENLLKHKFTHLPHRCVKCALCMRQYKYRQDLMVHLRMMHRDAVIELMRNGAANTLGATSTRHYPPRSSFGGVGSSAGASNALSNSSNRLSIMNVKANAVDIFDADDSIEVRNEPEIENELEDGSTNYALHSLFNDDEASRSSSQTSAKRAREGNGKRDAAPSTAGVSNSKEEVCEDYINYLCPQCGTECETRNQWSQHIEFVHDFMSRRGLNFKIINKEQAQCMECNKLVVPNNIKTLQTHKFNHLPNSEWLRCKLCYKGFKDRKVLQNHLLQQHHLDSIVATNDGSQTGFDEGNGMDDDQLLEESVPKKARTGGEYNFEPHIDYLCPHCGIEFHEKKLWRKHVMKTHQMNDLNTLNFSVVNDRQLKCNECEKVITNAYGIQNAQQHRITHLPYKAFARCRICRKTYTDRKGLIKHMATRHRIGWGANEWSDQPTSNQQQKNVKASNNVPRKQIVTVKNQTYEIVYLDEDDGDGDEFSRNDDTFMFGMVDEDISDINTSRSKPASITQRFNCVDCGSIFPSQSKLQTHIREEHEFLDFNDVPNSNSSATQSDKDSSTRKNDDNSSSIPFGEPTGAERHFIFLCPSCGEEYKTQYDWRRHINEVHNFDKRFYLNMHQIDKFRYRCKQCNDVVCNPKLKGLQDHHFRHLPFRLYLKCLVCGTCYNHKPNMMTHLRTRHNIFDDVGSDPPYSQPEIPTPKLLTVPHMTPVSGRSPKTRLLDSTVSTRPPGLNTIEDNISYHNAVDLDFITYFCPKCNKNFDSHAFWRKHIVEHHDYNSREGLNFRQIDNHHYLCMECYKRVTVTHTKGAIGQLQSHKFRHLPYRSFKCLTCNGEFVRKQMFFKHLNRETNRCDNKPIEDAGNSVKTDAELVEHHNLAQDKTTPEQKNETFKVEDDDITSADGQTKSDVEDDEHDIAMAGDSLGLDPDTYKLKCPQCGLEFNSNTSWREHIITKHELNIRANLNFNKIGEEFFQCRTCNEKIATKKLHLLQLHCFKHMPYGAFIRCQLCSHAGLSDMHDLQSHMRARHPHAVEVSQPTEKDDNDLTSEVQEPDGIIEDEDDDSNSHQFMPPIPPHLLGDDEDFGDQYLLG